jgi:hypothetical protein
VKVSFGTGFLLLEVGKLRAILRHFPNSFFVAQRQSWRVIDLMGDAPQNPILSSELKKRAARAISQIEEEERRRRYAEVMRGLEETRRRLEAQIGVAHSTREPSISESQIMLVSPTYARVDLYPKIAVCDKCGTFIDLKKLLRRASGYPPSCPECGGSLIQVNIVFICPKCSRVVELKPPRSIGKPDPNGTFICKGCRKPLVLNLVRENLSKSRWTCPECGEDANVYMKCEQCGEIMALRQTTQESLYARHVSVLLLGDRLFEEILRDVSSLKGLKLSEAVQDEQERAALRDVFALKDAILIPEVTSAIGVYGYSAFRDGEVITFKRSEYGRTRYKVYCCESRGMAILFRFDERQVNSAASNGEERFTLLHSIAHALVKQSVLEAGVEEGTFLAKVFDGDYAVLLYEARGAEAGGLEYVFKYRLPNLFINARRMLSQCRYQCDSACFDCLFINNALCHPKADYIPPNSFLNRRLVLKLWGL